MFMLIFLVLFGPKKSTYIVYKSSWQNNITHRISVVLYNRKVNHEDLRADEGLSGKLKKFLRVRYAFTTATSLLTSYILFSFWLFFFFFGESLLLITFSYNTPVDTINSSIFLSIKQHIIFFLVTIPTHLTNSINTYIYLLTSMSFIFLLNYNYIINYNYIRYTYINNTALLLIILLYTILF